MPNDNAAVALLQTHSEADIAVKELARSGFDVKNLSIVGKDYHPEGNAVDYRFRLESADTETQTVGCRHRVPEICARNAMEKVCAFVRADRLCLTPPVTWPKQYRKLKALAGGEH